MAIKVVSVNCPALKGVMLQGLPPGGSCSDSWPLPPGFLLRTFLSIPHLLLCTSNDDPVVNQMVDCSHSLILFVFFQSLTLKSLSGFFPCLHFHFAAQHKEAKLIVVHFPAGNFAIR